MTDTIDQALLAGLDAERRAQGEPSDCGRLVREIAPDGSQCRIVFAACPPNELDSMIDQEKARAAERGYELEWKTYRHDPLTQLPERLLAAGFEADDTEQVMVLKLTPESLARFATHRYEIRRIGASGLADYAEISRQIGRENVEEEQRQLAAELAASPGELSIHVAYVDGEPVACGRLYLKENSPYAELAGGRTKTSHRGRGLFTAVVAARLHEAVARERTHVFVDALPTSGPILAKRGFSLLTTTTPYTYEPE